MNASEIGNALQRAREDKGIDIAQAASDTRIRDYYLQAIEAGQFEKLPSPAQVRGFVRSYAAYLGLKAQALFALPGADEGPMERVEGEAKAEEAEGFPSGDVSGSGLAAQKFAEIGEQLRAQREVLALSLDEVEESTHIGARYLDWIERGDFEQFPSPTQARGMLNNYAAFLGLEREALEKFGEAVQAQFEDKLDDENSAPPRPIAGRRGIRVPKWARRFLSADVLIGVGLTLALAYLFIWGLGQVSSVREEQANPPTAPPLAGLLAPSPSATMQSTATSAVADEATNGGEDEAATPESVPQITIAVANPGGVDVQLLPNRRVWVRVSVDGSVEFEGRIAPGQSYSYSGGDEVLVYTGDAAAFRVFLNGQDLGVPGIEGEVIELLFSGSGLATPSAAPTASPDPNQASETPTPSNTPNPSPTVDGG